MKKIVALGAIAALACGMVFADEPAIDIKIAELSGEASVKWGVDLDAGQHGFSNSNKATLKVNLWNEGTKETTADDGNGDVWAEIQVKGKSAAFKGENKDGAGGKVNWDGDREATLEKAIIHFGPNFYVNIKSGNLQVGEYKPDLAIHGDQAWISSYGYGWSNGIEAGYDANAFKFSVDFRSYKATATDYTSAYGFKLGAELKDNLVPGLTAAAGFGMNLSTDYKDAEATGVEGATDKNTQAQLDKHKAAILDWDSTPAKNTDHAFTKDVSVTDGTNTVSLKNKIKNYHGMTYSAKAAYKLAIDDTFFVKPSVGFQGNYQSGTIIKGVVGTEEKAYTGNWNKLAFGALFGWGEQKDANAGVPFLDIDATKKVTPGVSVAAYIPLPTTITAGEYKNISYDSLAAVIVPSFYLGELVPNLSAAAYSEIGIYNYIKEANDKKKVDGKTVTTRGSAKENETFAFALAAGLAYKIEVEDYTITPKAGFRFVNGAYVSNGLAGSYSDIFKTDLGFQTMKKEGKDDRDKQTYKADFFNLKIGCDFAGFINNTTFSVNYNSANLLNAIGTEESWPAYDKDTKYYNVKAGQLDVGCKISL